MIPGNNQFAYCHQAEIRRDKIFHHSSHITPSTNHVHHLRRGYVQTYITYDDNKSYVRPTKVTQRHMWIGPYAKYP